MGDMGKQQRLPPPLLLTSHGLLRGLESWKHSFYSLLENRYYTTCIPILPYMSVLCSAYGWLVLLDRTDGECCLWNPTDDKYIYLPDEVENPSSYNRCFLSKPPTEPDCFILLNHFSTMKQIFCRIEDNDFIKSNLFEEGYALAAMISFKGMIYGIVRPAGKTPKYEFVTVHMVRDKIEIKSLLIDGELPWEVPLAIRSWITFNQVYLIESPCGNEILLVIINAFVRDSRLHFRIFRVDVDRMECEEVDNLDGRTIFINFDGNGFCRSSESFGAAMKPNSIYYTDRFGRVMNVYNLDDRSTITLLPYPDADIDPGSAKNYWVDIPMEIILKSHVTSVVLD